VDMDHEHRQAEGGQEMSVIAYARVYVRPRVRAPQHRILSLLSGLSLLWRHTNLFDQVLSHRKDSRDSRDSILPLGSIEIGKVIIRSTTLIRSIKRRELQ
jgi:hypothetical protein